MSFLGISRLFSSLFHLLGHTRELSRLGQRPEVWGVDQTCLYNLLYFVIQKYLHIQLKYMNYILNIYRIGRNHGMRKIIDFAEQETSTCGSNFGLRFLNGNGEWKSPKEKKQIKTVKHMKSRKTRKKHISI